MTINPQPHTHEFKDNRYCPICGMNKIQWELNSSHNLLGPDFAETRQWIISVNWKGPAGLIAPNQHFHFTASEKTANETVSYVEELLTDPLAPHWELNLKSVQIAEMAKATMLVFMRPETDKFDADSDYNVIVSLRPKS